MIKKLMDISGAQVLGKEELKHVMGGQWIVVCFNGQRFFGGSDQMESIEIIDFMCDGDGYSYELPN
jgi:hypothetical protein